MPPVVAAVAAALVSAGVGAATAAIVANIVVGVLVSIGTSLASKALLGKPDDFGDRGQTLSFRAALAPAQIVYGETRVGGPLPFVTTSGGARQTDNQLLWMVVALAGHEVEEISDVYFSDEIVQFQPESVVATPSLFRGAAIGTTQADPWGGLGQDGGYAFCIKRLGTHDQALNPNFRGGFGFHNLNGVILDGDTFKGVAHLSLLFNYNPTLFPAGPPNVSARVKGRKVYDPRNPAHDIDDPATWAWSANAALCVADYLRGCPMETGAGVVRPYGMQATDDEIDWSTVIEAANICDESVALAAGGTESRYTCNGMIDSDVPPGDAIKALLSSMAGYRAWSGGQWKIFAGAYRTPTVLLGDDDQCGRAATIAKRSRRDLFNGVKGTFRGPKSAYQATSFPPVNAAAFVEQDNGEEIWQDIELPFTDTPSACQRISRIELQRNRQQIVTERRFKLSALGTQVGDVIGLTDPRKGWTDKAFEIHKWTLATAQDENAQPFLCIDMTLQETSPGTYDWSVDDELGFDDAPDTNLPRPWEVAVPGAPGIIEELYVTRDGAGVKTRLTISWADALESYFLDYIPEYKLTSATEWTVLPSVTGTSIVVPDFGAGIYDFRVKTRNRLGVPSLYSTSTGLTVYGLGATPETLTGLGIQPQGNQALLAWDVSPDLDVRAGGHIEFRHSPSFAAVTWDAGTSIRDEVFGGATSATLPLKAGTYLIRPVDSSGIAGGVTTVTTKQASVNGYTSLAGSPIIEDPTFAGTHSFTTGTGSVLTLANDGLWDDIADLDLAGTIDDLGSLSQSGTYTFATRFNLGAVTNARLTSKIEAVVTSLFSAIDDRVELMDDWEDFDGTDAGGSADAWVEYRQTDTDPTGSPTWTAWMRLDTAEAAFWGCEMRCQLRAFQAEHNVEISTLEVAAEAIV